MGRNKDDFLKFKKEFTKYQKLFGLTGHRVYFKYEQLEGCFANITCNQPDMVATARLNNGEKYSLCSYCSIVIPKRAIISAINVIINPNLILFHRSIVRNVVGKWLKTASHSIDLCSAALFGLSGV